MKNLIFILSFTFLVLSCEKEDVHSFQEETTILEASDSTLNPKLKSKTFDLIIKAKDRYGNFINPNKCLLLGSAQEYIYYIPQYRLIEVCDYHYPNCNTFKNLPSQKLYSFQGELIKTVIDVDLNKLPFLYKNNQRVKVLEVQLK